MNRGTDALTHLTHFSYARHEREFIAGGERTGRHSPHRRNASGVSGASGEAAQLHALAQAVGRLTPSHRDPERFHMDKAEIVGELRRLATALAFTK